MPKGLSVAFIFNMEEEVTTRPQIVYPDICLYWLLLKLLPPSSFVQAFKWKAPSVRRVLRKYTERVWEVRSVRPNHFNNTGEVGASKKKSDFLKKLEKFFNTKLHAVQLVGISKQEWIYEEKTYKCVKELRRLTPLQEKVESTITDVPGVQSHLSGESQDNSGRSLDHCCFMQQKGAI